MYLFLVNMLLQVRHPTNDRVNEIDQDLFNCKIGIDYPKPIVDISKTYKNATSQLWTMKNDSEVKIESKRILQKHTNSDRTAFDR